MDYQRIILYLVQYTEYFSMAEQRSIDDTDLQILEALQQDGRLSNAALARRIGLTSTPCLERVRRLERDGYILGYSARLNPRLLDAGLLVFVEIRLSRNSPVGFQDFRRRVLEIPEILDCHLVSGNFDYLIKARVKDMDAYRQLLGDRLLNLPGVDGSRTYVVMEQVKESLELPVNNGSIAR